MRRFLRSQFFVPFIMQVVADSSLVASSPTQPSINSWQRNTRSLVGSAHVRDRIEAYALLSDKCAESKHMQLCVGAFLREVQDDHSANSASPLLDRVVCDVQAPDRTLRVAAARVLCRVAYESLQDQEAIIKCQQALADDRDSTDRWLGVTVGWLHVLAVPDAVRRRFQGEEAMSSPTAHKRLATFVRRLVVANYARVYHLVSRYYAAHCHSFLPVCWRIPVHKCEREHNELGELEQTDDCMDDDVPDPSENLIAFFLAPRRVQFPEPDAVLADEMLRSLATPDEVTKVMAAQQLFDRMRTSGCEPDCTELAWLFEGRTSAGSTTWTSCNHLLVECCARLNEGYLAAQHGAATLELLRSIFRVAALQHASGSTLTPPDLDVSVTSAFAGNDLGGNLDESFFAWEPVLIGAILEHPALTPSMKRQLGHLQPPHQDVLDTCAACQLPRPPNRVALVPMGSSISAQPWRHIVSVSVAHISPITWRMFLAKWRTLNDEYPLQDSSAPGEPRPSVSAVCSVASMRKSIQATNPRTYRNLEQFRDQLPSLFKSQRTLGRSIDASSSAKEVRVCRCVEPPAPDLSYGNEASDEEAGSDCDPLDSMDPSASHRIKKSSRSELDAMSRQRMQQRRAKQASRHATNVAKQRQLVATELQQKRETMDARLEQVDANLEALELQRAQDDQQKARRQYARRQKAEWRRAQQREIDEAIHQAIRDRSQHSSQPTPKPAPRTCVTPRRPPTQSQRPKSARDRPTTARVSIAPGLSRERARVYGDAVRKIHAANSADDERAPPRASSHAPPGSLLARRFSTYRFSSFRNKLANDDSPSPRRRISLAHYAMELALACEDQGDTRYHESGALSSDNLLESVHEAAVTSVENACSTLVMQQAALQVAERVSIPPVPPPRVEEPHVPPYVVLAQYESLDEADKLKFRARFNLQRVRHQLSFELLRQFTRLARRDYAWRAFHERASPSTGSVRHADFVDIAQKLLGGPQKPKQLLRTARKLDEHKSGWVEWKAFYTWWCLQFDPAGSQSDNADDDGGRHEEDL